jgi:hypothetical protein
LGFKAAQLLHEIRALHQGHVGKVQVAEDLILEASRSFLARTRQIDSARVAPQTFLVVVVVVVDAGRFCTANKQQRSLIFVDDNNNSGSNKNSGRNQLAEQSLPND